MAGPYDKFQESFETFQTQLREEIKEALSAVKQELMQEIRQLTTTPVDPLLFRHELLQDIEQKFAEFKEELAVALEGNGTLPPFPHVDADDPATKKTTWLDKPLSSWLDKKLF